MYCVIISDKRSNYWMKEIHINVHVYNIDRCLNTKY